MENVRNRIDFTLVNDEKKYLKLVRDPRYNSNSDLIKILLEFQDIRHTQSLINQSNVVHVSLI